MLQPLRMSRAALAGGTCLLRGPRLHFSSIAGNVSRNADRFRLPDTPCRTRFAPSPTGYLHLGSLRTALFNYLLARATGGQFVLRIEDTDQSRLVPDAEQRLYEDLRWVGLSWDEGPNMEEAPYGPYRQSERLPLYKEHAAKLLHHGKAYRCFCSPEALEQHKLAARELGEPTLYPGTCRRLSPAESGGRAAKGEPFAIRFKSAKSPTMIQDIIYSRYQKKEPEDDYIIMKRDGFPTYHFANVVDDHHMKITHVIRGAEWLISTPKHIELYQAFGWEPPLFAHVGLLVGPNRQKLSKRDNAANIAWYRDSLILPGALLNFAALLGWRGRGQYGDFMALQDMVDNFSLQFTKGDIVVNMEKLPFLQDKHFARLAEKEEDPANRSLIDSHVLQPFKAAIEEAESARKAAAAGGGGASTASSSGGPIDVASLGQRLPAPRILLDERFHKDVVRTVAAATAAAADPADRYRRAVSTLQYHIWDLGPGVLRRALVQPSSRFRHEYWRAHWSAGGMWLEAALLDLANMVGGAAVTEAAWTREALEALLREPPLTNPTPRLLRGLLGEKALYIILRWALVGSERSLPISHTMEILGREETLRRLEAARVVAEEFEAEVTAKPPRQMEGQEPPGKSGKTGK